jgi:hypothetical protein
MSETPLRFLFLGEPMAAETKRGDNQARSPSQGHKSASPSEREDGGKIDPGEPGMTTGDAAL